MEKKMRGIVVFLLFIVIIVPISAANPKQTSSDTWVEIAHMRGIIFIHGKYHSVNRTDGFNISFIAGDIASYRGFVYVYDEGTFAFMGGDTSDITGIGGFIATSFFGHCRSGSIFGFMHGNMTLYAIL
jgi:hypothetical protein